MKSISGARPCSSKMGVRLAGSGADGQPRSFEAAQHIGRAGIGPADVAALDRVAGAVKFGRLLDPGFVGVILGEGVPQRRPDIAHQVHAGDVCPHGVKDLAQGGKDTRGGIQQGSVHVKQDSIVG